LCLALKLKVLLQVLLVQTGLPELQTDLQELETDLLEQMAALELTATRRQPTAALERLATLEAPQQVCDISAFLSEDNPMNKYLPSNLGLASSGLYPVGALSV